MMDTTLDLSKYPSTWKELIGQAGAKAMLQRAVKSAKLRKTRLDHVLIAYPDPGVGKTAIAVRVAQDMGTNARVISGQLSRDAARLLFSELDDGDVILYTEFHQVMQGGRSRAEWLKQYLENGVIVGPRGPEAQPAVTIVADTTDAHKIPSDILGRFIMPPLVPYSPEEMAKIVTAMSKKFLVVDGLLPVTGRNARLMGDASGGNCRAVARMLVVLRDMAITGEMDHGYEIPTLLATMGVSRDGLDPMAQRYLTMLGGEFAGSAGEAALGGRLQVPGGLDDVERILMDKGYITKTRTGRVLTQAGIRRYRELEAS